MITTLGPRLQATGADPLPWELLEEADGVYFTAGDAAAVRRARRAVLVASTRHLEAVIDAGVRADARGERARSMGRHDLRRWRTRRLDSSC